MGKKRTRRGSAFKAKVALAALKERESVSALASQYAVHATQIHAWKRQLLERVEELFAEGNGSRGKREAESSTAELYEQIGRLKMELEWLKKKLTVSAELRRGLIDREHPDLSVRRQCELMGLSRSMVYYAGAEESELNIQLMRLIDGHYLKRPCFGSRRMTL